MSWIAQVVNPDGDNGGYFADSPRIPSAFGELVSDSVDISWRSVIHRPVIWFWGHEHKLAIYDRYSVLNGIPVYGRCIRHGQCPFCSRGTCLISSVRRWLGITAIHKRRKDRRGI